MKRDQYYRASVVVLHVYLFMLILWGGKTVVYCPFHTLQRPEPPQLPRKNCKPLSAFFETNISPAILDARQLIIMGSLFRHLIWGKTAQIAQRHDNERLFAAMKRKRPINKELDG